MTPRGEPFAVKWPKHLQRQIPQPGSTQDLPEAFAWPSKAKANASRIREKMEGSPILGSGARISLCSFFSGICSQSRGADILQNHEFGVSFDHLSFVEKAKQCQRTLARDYPESCCFKNQMLFLNPKDKLAVEMATSAEEVQRILKRCGFSDRVWCTTHKSFCRVPSAEMAILGAPCVDDSMAGKKQEDEGAARKAT